MTSANLKVPIYEVIVKVVLVDDMQLYYNSFRENGIDLDDDGTGHRDACAVIDLSEYSIGHTFEFIVLKGQENNDGNIVHEVFHLTTAIMNYVGIVLCSESEEAWAYLQQYLYNKIKLIVKDLRNKEDE